MTTDQALQLAIAESEFPDLMRNISFATMAELAAAGKLLPLDKYFNDPENYPIFAEADMQELLKFRVNGVLYGIAGFGWRIRHDDPAWVWPMWCMRLRVGMCQPTLLRWARAKRFSSSTSAGLL